MIFTFKEQIITLYKKVYQYIKNPKIEQNDIGKILVAKEIGDGSSVEWKAQTLYVEQLPNDPLPYTFYILKNPNTQTQTIYYYDENWKIIGGDANNSEIGDIVYGNNLDTMDKVIAKYGGNTWQQIYGAIYGVGGDYSNGVGISKCGAVSQSMPNTTFTGSQVNTSTYSTTHNHYIYFSIGRRGTSSASTNTLGVGSGGGTFTLQSNGDHTHTLTSNGTITYSNSSSSSITKNGYVRANGYATYFWLRTE